MVSLSDLESSHSSYTNMSFGKFLSSVNDSSTPITAANRRPGCWSYLTLTQWLSQLLLTLPTTAVSTMSVLSSNMPAKMRMNQMMSRKTTSLLWNLQVFRRLVLLRSLPRAQQKIPRRMKSQKTKTSVRPPYDNLLVTVFELAQALQYEELANAAIDSYCKALAEDPPSAWGLLYLQRKGLQQSKLMKLMLRAIAWCIKSDGYEAWEDQDFMKGFVKASTANSGMVMKAMADHHDETNPFQGGIETCEYHEHVMTARCPKKRGSVGKEGKAKKQKRA